MADIKVTNPITPQGGILVLDQPDQRIYAPSGVGVIKGAVYIKAAAARAQIDPSIKIELPAGFKAQAGAVQCAATNCRVNCEIDIGGNPMQGVQVIKWDGDIPESTNIDNLYAYNNAQTPGDPDKNHGIYIQDSIGLTGKNIRFSSIKGGWGIHFYCNQQVKVSKGARLTNITCEDNLGDVIFWGPGVTDNKVEKLLSLNPGKWSVLHWNASAQNVGNTLDYVSVPTPGYGHQPNGDTTPPPDPDNTQAWADWYAKAPAGSIEEAGDAWTNWYREAPTS